MPLSDYPASELTPRHLTPDEMQDPTQVFNELFQLGHLPQIRQDLWELFKASVTGNHFKTLSHRERSNMVLFYERLQKVIEAVHIVYQKK
jgi:hypothetical protein